jgi:ABC-type Fe3+-hydroxamate transport system substrate-binding protein
VAVSPRIVSLVPSGTETLLRLGAPVLACTRFCEQPGIPHVGGTKNPDVGAIIALEPDLVVMDSEENRREDADELTAAGVELFVSDVTTVDGAERFVMDLADRAGRPRPTQRRPPLQMAAPSATAFVPIWRRPWMSVNRRDLRCRPARSAGRRAGHR